MGRSKAQKEKRRAKAAQKAAKHESKAKKQTKASTLSNDEQLKIILEVRQKELKTLDQHVVAEMVSHVVAIAPVTLQEKDPCDQWCFLLRHHHNVALSSDQKLMDQKTSMLMAKLLIDCCERALGRAAVAPAAAADNRVQQEPQPSGPKKISSDGSSTSTSSSMSSAKKNGQENSSKPNGPGMNPITEATEMERAQGSNDPARRPLISNSKFSLSNFCSVNNAYGEPTENTTAITSSMAQKSAKLSSTQQASNKPRPPPPPYEKRSQKLGPPPTAGHRKGSSVSSGGTGKAPPKKSSQSATSRKEELAKLKAQEAADLPKRLEAERQLSLKVAREAQQQQLAEEERKRQAAAAQQKKLAEEQRKQAVEEKRKQIEKQMELKRAEEARKQRQAKEEAELKKKQEDAAKKAAELKKKQEAAAAKKAAEEEAQKRREAEEEQKRQAAAKEQQRKLEEEKRKQLELKRAEEEARKRKLAEEAAKVVAEVKAAERKKRLAEEEQKRQAAAKEQQKKAAVEQKRRAAITAVLKSGVKPGDTSFRYVQFPPDHKPTKSCALEGRQETTIRFTPSILTESQADNLSSRLAKYDPYWQVSHYVGSGITTSLGITQNDYDNLKVATVAETTFSIRQNDIKDMKKTDWGVTPVSDGYSAGQKRLILRMLPVVPTDKSRADSHLWPKGTFLAVNQTVLNIFQRKQQAHDKKKWLGLSKLVDLTSYIRNPSIDNQVKICTYDEKQYFFCIALCTYTPPATLFQMCASVKPGVSSDSSFERLSREQSTDVAKAFTKQDMLTIDDSDDEGGNQEEAAGQFIFTLTCPFSKSIMATPVRGKNCAHFQCFDLRFFLESNSIVHGQNWRCHVCEKHVSLQDLQLDQLTEDLILEFGKEVIPTERDRVEFRSDGTYTLLPVRKQRNGKKRTKREPSSSNGSGRNAQPSEPEIILLD